MDGEAGGLLAGCGPWGCKALDTIEPECRQALEASQERRSG